MYIYIYIVITCDSIRYGWISNMMLKKSYHNLIYYCPLPCWRDKIDEMTRNVPFGQLIRWPIVGQSLATQGRLPPCHAGWGKHSMAISLPWNLSRLAMSSGEVGAFSTKVQWISKTNSPMNLKSNYWISCYIIAIYHTNTSSNSSCFCLKSNHLVRWYTMSQNSCPRETPNVCVIWLWRPW